MTTLNHTLYELTTNVDSFTFDVKVVRFNGPPLVDRISIARHCKDKWRDLPNPSKEQYRKEATENVLKFLKVSV